MNTAQRPLQETYSEDVKWSIISHLNEQGYATYASRLLDFNFVVAHKYLGEYIPVAAMFPKTGDIVINPSMANVAKIISTKDPISLDPQTKLLDQLSLLVRHELLHFMLVHQKRFVDHLKKIDPNWKHTLHYPPIDNRGRAIDNVAMDYEISIQGYDSHDKEVVRLMTLNNEVVGGLLIEDRKDHPEWATMTMEQLYDDLVKEHQANLSNPANKPKTTVRIHKATHSPEYKNMYNKIISLLDDPAFTDGDLAKILSDAIADNDIIAAGNLLLAKGK